MGDKVAEKIEDNVSDASIFSDGGANKFDWSTEHEEILIEWADKAMCYRWMHSKSYDLFATLNALYTIPVIIIQTLAGTANFAQQRVPVQYQALFMMVVGGFNILGGIITTIQQFLKITQLCEAHRVSSISWDKFYRNVKIEIAKHPLERIDAKQMLKMCKEEFDRLMETSPPIPDKIIKTFTRKLGKMEDYDNIVKPEICDSLIPTSTYRNPWANDENQNKALDENIKVQMNKQNKIKKINEINKKHVNDFINMFRNLNNRDPLESEIVDNLKDKMDINIIKKYADEIKSEQAKIIVVQNDVELSAIV